MASRHPSFSFLFFHGLDHKWLRDTLQENKGYRFFRGCQILERSDKFSQSYDHYNVLCKLASGHTLTCLRKLFMFQTQLLPLFNQQTNELKLKE